MSLLIVFSLLVAASGSHAALKRIKGRNLLQSEGPPLCVLGSATDSTAAPSCSLSDTVFQQAVPAYADTYNDAMAKAFACTRADNGATSGSACFSDADEYCESVGFAGTPYCVVAGTNPAAEANLLYEEHQTFDDCGLFEGLLTASGGVRETITPECETLAHRFHDAGCVGDCTKLQTLFSDVEEACAARTTPATCPATGSIDAQAVICGQSLFANTLTCAY